MIDSLSRIDTNLLVALHFLLEEANVTRAAARVGCSQSAMSQKLQRARDALNDPLLVRHRRGMVLTERAQTLAGPLAVALRALNDVVEPPVKFEPSEASGVFHIGARTAPIGYFPALVRRVAEVAPRLTLVGKHVTGEKPMGERLADGDVDLIVQPRRRGGVSGLTRTSEEHIEESLFASHLVDTEWLCVVREDHPTIRGSLSLDEFVSVGHVLTSPRGDAYGLVDRALEKLGRSRHVAAVTQDFMLSWYQATTTDLLLTTNQMVAYHMQDLSPGQVLPVPIEMPEAETIMLWHARTHHSPMHRWIRSQLSDVCAEMATQMK